MDLARSLSSRLYIDPRMEAMLEAMFGRRPAGAGHRQRIMNKLSAHSLAQMQRVAARYGGLTS